MEIPHMAGDSIRNELKSTKIIIEMLVYQEIGS